jgi:death-on-curing protein
VKEPLFLDVEGVLLLHRRSIERFGGTLGIRDRSGLESAVHHPQNVFNFGGDVFDVAAAYAFHLAESQCFLDGNKRTAAAAALNFLAANGIRSDVDDLKLYDLMIGIAERRATKADLAAYFREVSTPR